MQLDIRTKVFILFTTSICVFVANTLYFEILVLIGIGFIQFLSTKVFNIKIISIYFVLVLLQLFLLPILPETFSMVLSIPVVQFRKVFPGLMALILIIKTTQVSQLIATMTKMKIPKSVTITFAVTLRYFPAIKEEWGHIKDAMKIRKISSNSINPFKNIGQKMECYMVPLLISASKTSDELAAAAVTRGIDNPNQFTCRQYRELAFNDYLIMSVCLIFIVASVLIKLGLFNF